MNKTIGQRIRELRKSHGWTQAQVAELAGTGEQYIRHLESGYRKPGRDTLIALARVFDVSVDDLLPDRCPNCNGTGQLSPTSQPAAPSAA